LKNTIYDIISELDCKRKINSFKIVNKGFEKLKISVLKSELQSCSKIKFNNKKHYTIRQLGFKTIYKLSSKGNKRWDKYFQDGGKVYIKSYSTREPMCDRILFEKKIKKYIGKEVPLPKKVKPPKRSYIKGGVGGKVYGFDFYLRDDKLYPKQRKTLLSSSENYIDKIIDEQIKTRGGIEKIDKKILENLDSGSSDKEIVDTWNRFFQNYGMRFPEFEDKWMKLFGNDLKESDELVWNEKEHQNMKKKIEEVRQLLSINKKLDF